MLSVFCFIIVTFLGSRGPVAEMPPTNANVLSDCQKMIIVPPITNLLSALNAHQRLRWEKCAGTPGANWTLIAVHDGQVTANTIVRSKVKDLTRCQPFRRKIPC